MPNLILAISPIISTSDKSIYIPVEDKLQAINVVEAYGLDKLDSAELLEYHFGVIDGNPYQEHMSFNEFKDAINRETYVINYIKDGEDEEEPFEESSLASAMRRADMLHELNKETWSDVSLGKYVNGDYQPITEYTPKSQMAPIDFHEIRTPKYVDTYVLCYTDHAGNDQEINFEALDLAAAHKIADDKCNVAQGAWTDISLMFYSNGQQVDIPEYVFKPMKVYTLWYLDECGKNCEDEFEAISDEKAIEHAMNKCRGNEGLWQHISLTSSDEIELEFNPF